MKINTALITCAGFGTRFLPISKTIQKEMLPIINRPAIDYLVADCVKAGITEIVIVMNAHNYQPLHYYRENKRLEKYLTKTGKAELYQIIKEIPTQANFYFVKQTDHDPYGTSIPIKLAKDYLQDQEAFLFLSGDDFVYFPDNHRSLVGELIQLQQDSQAEAVITCVELPPEELCKYGEARTRNENGFDYLTELVEKPPINEVQSKFASISKYVLPNRVLELINQQQPNPENNEYYLTDIVSQIVADSKVAVKKADGYFLNAGEPSNWLRANLAVASQDPKLRADIETFMENDWQRLTASS